MQRVFNEYRSDSKRKAHFGHGGVKVGDFGTGGRVYERGYTVSSSTPAQQGRQRQGVSFCCGFIALVLLVVVERWLYLTSGCVEEARAGAVSLPTPTSDSAWDGRLVFTTTNPARPPTVGGGPPLTDPLFASVRMPDRTGAVQRKTEYCQWREHRHTKRTQVGNEPDYCTSSGSSSENCAGARCSSRSVGACGGPCCRVRQGAKKYKEEVWYTYHKAWRTTRINSLMFDNPAAYHNPTRDPAPTTHFYVGGEGIDLSGGSGSGLHVSGKDLAPAMMPAAVVPLYKSAVSDLPGAALQQGFHEADHRFFYSRVPKDGLNNPIIRAAASYLVDGVLDVNEISKATGIEGLLGKAGLGWITKGTCNAGDIRVSFLARRIPDAVSLLGKQVSSGGGLSLLVPNIYSNGQTMFFMRSGVMDLAGLLKMTLSDEQFWTNVYRGGIALLLVAGSWIGLEAGLVNALAVAGTFGSVALTAIWWFFYGTGGVAIPAVAAVLFGGYTLFVMAPQGSSPKSKEEKAD
jgi:hypothetical protein